MTPERRKEIEEEAKYFDIGFVRELLSALTDTEAQLTITKAAAKKWREAWEKVAGMWKELKKRLDIINSTDPDKAYPDSFYNKTAREFMKELET